ncbi:PadR family transcriptional regulator [Brevibacillus sp. SYP-B805]|uniref:PadR family transcriptional regulator n=1 Tax=Brevibacillus sp. SYP-B805 TaxID=1578199 RepID=UPI0013EA6936|nr:PadR family transcriptional regulator [Brevibacillus sp. SYP-B805]NGQ93895.1 PadR family transcriptional regulator [Brevibacillus sp. SYP-B805]
MLELAILGFLREEPMHGYELKQRLTMLTGHFRPVSDGALYPAIARLEKHGWVVKRQEQGKAASVRLVLTLTESGEKELLDRLAHPDDVDISDRNRFFTFLAFLKYLPKDQQRNILARRLSFLEAGRSFFSAGGNPVGMRQEEDPFRRGMLHIARETSRVEKEWLRAQIALLADEALQ